jgi:RHS repeat-associated protein
LHRGTHMQARFYLPMYGRFASPDPARDQHFEQTQSWNIFSYVQNNPIMFIDPDGMATVPAGVSGNFITFLRNPWIEGTRSRLVKGNNMHYAYLDNRGFATIGIGHFLGHKGLTEDDKNTLWSDSKTDAVLRSDLASSENIIKDLVDTDLNQQQFDALVDLVFNYGKAGFLRAGGDDILDAINAGKLDNAALLIGEMKSNPDRRLSEQRMFTDGNYKPIAQERAERERAAYVAKLKRAREERMKRKKKEKKEADKKDDDN